MLAVRRIAYSIALRIVLYPFKFYSFSHWCDKVFIKKMRRSNVFMCCMWNNTFARCVWCIQRTSFPRIHFFGTIYERKRKGAKREKTEATEWKRARANKSGDSVLRPRKKCSQLHQRSNKTKNENRNKNFIYLFIGCYAYKWAYSFRRWCFHCWFCNSLLFLVVSWFSLEWRAAALCLFGTWLYIHTHARTH